jgi:hypothetical protein
MKKVSILLLLTVVLTSFTFAIEGVGDFEAALEVDFNNVNIEDGLTIVLYPSINFSRAFGAFSLSATLGDNVGIPTAEGSDVSDELYLNITPSYSLAAGPGELGFALGLQLNVPITEPGGPDEDYSPDNALTFYIDPSISYSLDASFGSLAFSLGTDHIRIAKDDINDDLEVAYGLSNIGLYFKAGVDLSFGLGFWVKPVLTIDTTDSDADILDKFVFDIHYAITDAIKAGVETTIPTGEKEIETDGITIKPYGNFSFGALSAYVKVAIGAIANDVEKDIAISPIVGVSYSF